MYTWPYWRAALKRQLAYTTAQMADAEPPPTPRKIAENHVALFLNGGQCTTTQHEAASDLDKLVMLKMLRLDMPHQSMALAELESAIRKAGK